MLKKFLQVSVFSLGLSLVCPGSVLSATIGLFNNPSYTVGTWTDNLITILQTSGHTVNLFSSLEASQWQKQAQENQLLMIGPFSADLVSDLSVATINVIENYVDSGGGFVITGTEDNGFALWEQIFGFNILVGDAFGQNMFLNEENAAGTIFAGGPTALMPANFVIPVSIDSLPTGAKSIYDDRNNSSALFVAPYGQGKTANIGFDFDKVFQEPLWKDVTDLTVQFVAGTPLTPVAVPESSLLIGLISLGMGASVFCRLG